jgi:CDP-diacylglycerol--glycerol-3-phosphate 3-phosphatidyltransferase
MSATEPLPNEPLPDGTLPDGLLPNGFGPSALATPANAVTILRLLLAPVAFGLIVDRPVSWLTWAVWAGLACSDGLDGYLARKHGTTRSGAFLDPLADKVLVLGGMVALVSIDRFSWIPVAIIAVREIVISLYRSYWGRRGIAIPASRLAKAKTFSQSVAVGFAVWPPTAEHLSWSADVMLWVSVALAVVSGVEYLVAGQRALTRSGSH